MVTIQASLRKESTSILKKIKKMKTKTKGYIDLDYIKLVRLMAKDYSQRKNIEYIMKHLQPIAKFASKKMLLAIVAMQV
jgi:replicative DNA helicase